MLFQKDNLPTVPPMTSWAEGAFVHVNDDETAFTCIKSFDGHGLMVTVTKTLDGTSLNEALDAVLPKAEACDWARRILATFPGE